MRFLILTLLLLTFSCTHRSSESVPNKITGTIDVSPTLQKSLLPTDVLYIIVREQQIGPPTAVKQITHPKFPLKYVIGAEDTMIPGMAEAFKKDTKLTVAARISRSGDAKPAAGDLEGVYKNNPTKPSGSGVDVTIDLVREK